MSARAIRISYDTAKIPPGFRHPFEFSRRASEQMDVWLSAADAGRWAGSESLRDPETGAIQMAVRFKVEDADRAEALIAAAVEGTPFAQWARFERID